MIKKKKIVSFAYLGNKRCCIIKVELIKMEYCYCDGYNHINCCIKWITFPLRQILT